MSSAQHVDTTEDAQSGTAHAEETAGLAAAVMQRAQWMQRVLSPWTQRWLATGDSEAASERSGSQRPFASLTGADTHRTLTRMRVQYESHTNLETPITGGSLPLAGAVERPAAAVEATSPAASAAPRRAQGPYSKPFNSLDDFIHAIEAAKERNYAPPPTEVQPQPAPKRTLGPYSRPFQSMEEFVQAVNAAKERNYEPPPEAQPQPASQHARGPYSRAFSSFEDFVKAVEETRSQWGQGAAGESSAATAVPPETQPSVPPARVRPISRIEELPVRTETRAVNSPIDFPAPPEISQPAPPAEPAPLAPRAAARSQPASTPAAAPRSAVAAASPQVQRSPLEPAADLSEPEDEAESAVQRSIAPTLQRLETPSRSETAAATVDDGIEPAVAASDQIVQRSSQPAAPQSQPLDMPLVQRHAAASEAVEEERPTDAAAPIEIDQPIVQRQAAEIPHQPDVNFTAHPSIQKSPAQAEAPSVQRHATDTASQSTTSRATLPSADEEHSTRAETPIVQRQVANASPQPGASQTPTIQPDEPLGQQQTSSAAHPEPVATPFAKPDMPLVQRHAADELPASEDAEDLSASMMQRQVAEMESAAPERPPAQPTLPGAIEPPQSMPVQTKTVQRRSAETIPAPDQHAPTPSADVAPARSPQMPLVQRQLATPEPAQSVEPFAEAPVELPTADHSAVVPPQPETPTAARAAGVEMPLVQRRATEAPAAADEIEQAEEIVQRSVDRTAPDQIVQRQIAEAKPTTPVASTANVPRVSQAIQPAEKKIVTPLAEAKSPAAHVEMPLVQRQAAELDVEEPTTEDTAPAKTVQRTATTTEAQSRSTATPAIKPAVPSVQRHIAEPIEAIEPGGPIAAESSTNLPASAEAYAAPDMPLVQRKPVDNKAAATSLAVVQRSVTSDGTEAAAQPAFDLSERILSRVAPPERRAVTKPVDLPLHHAPVQRESQPETVAASRPATSDYHSTPAATSSITASPAPVIQRLAEPAIQRTPSESETSSSDAGFIQRVESVPAAAEQAAEDAKPPDLDQLARQVYPLIKRMIAIERERRAFR